jgi:hypothetical protein
LLCRSRAPLAAGLLLVASCGIGVTENLAASASHSDGASEAGLPMDALAAEHPNDATAETQPDLGTDVLQPDAKDDANDEIAEPGLDAGSTGEVADAGVDQMEDAPSDVNETDAPSDGNEPDVAPDAHDVGTSGDRPETGSDGGASDGQVTTMPCQPSEPFGPPALVTVMNPGGSLVNGSVSSDERVAYLAIDTGGQIDISISVRAERFVPFGSPTPLSALNTTYSDASPSVTADGLTIYIDSTRNGGYRIYRAERMFLGAEFSTPQLLTEIGDVSVGSPWVTPDGRVLYFHAQRDTNEIERVVRNGAGFSSPERVPLLNVDEGDLYNPVVTPDELVIFVQAASGIWTASRESTELPFGPADQLSDLDTLHASRVPNAISITPDGCRLYYVQYPERSPSQLYVAERVPPS